MIATSRSRLASRLLRRFAGQGLFVTGAASLAVMVLAAGEYRGVAQVDPAPSGTLITWSSAIAPDGKLQQRHGAQPQERDLARLFTASVPTESAAQAMPLTLGWSQKGPARQDEPATRAPLPRAARTQPVESTRLAVANPEKPRSALASAEPLVIRPLEQAGSRRSDNPGLIGAVTRPVTATVARATGLVTGAASAVGAAGSWTLSQAASLIPRW